MPDFVIARAGTEFTNDFNVIKHRTFAVIQAI